MTERERDSEFHPDEQPPQQEPPDEPWETEIIECEECGTDAEVPEGVEVCETCAEAAGFAALEAPEGGWTRGSDMDRI